MLPTTFYKDPKIPLNPPPSNPSKISNSLQTDKTITLKPPNAPCMEYLPTFTIHFSQTIHGASYGYIIYPSSPTRSFLHSSDRITSKIAELALHKHSCSPPPAPTAPADWKSLQIPKRFQKTKNFQHVLRARDPTVLHMGVEPKIGGFYPQNGWFIRP